MLFFFLSQCEPNLYEALMTHIRITSCKFANCCLDILLSSSINIFSTRINNVMPSYVFSYSNHVSIFYIMYPCEQFNAHLCKHFLYLLYPCEQFNLS